MKIIDTFIAPFRRQVLSYSLNIFGTNITDCLRINWCLGFCSPVDKDPDFVRPSVCLSVCFSELHTLLNTLVS